ncbi:alpha/beta hydrolase [Enterococcus devriesei]|uniref:alpha/beta hydrolase n=1 Tax=Enterococcus devriesei TaxID=319970 RepID=UPI001C11353E|nr:alpha/beta hydrolase [Enterococcus devriesei]MBU5366206.1 alpha/beta hydrolase [Enterococcus devriesei]MDT2821679.1 alpha/beta hydrolase [Enterococcus devriesei]
MINDVVYDEKNQLTLDIYEPETIDAAIILIHGGGWFRGDKAKEQALAERLTTDGFLVVAPNYRLAPDHLFPAAMEDLLTVYDWLVASDYPVKDKITALGSSAGGNLAIELALQKGIPAASWSGIIDLYPWVQEHPEVIAAMNQKPDFDKQASGKIDQDGVNDAFYKWFILNYVNQDMDLLEQADPLQRVSSKSGPIFIANSLHELVPLSGVYHLQAALAEAGVPSENKLITGTVHGEGYADIAYQPTLQFLKSNLSERLSRTRSALEQ